VSGTHEVISKIACGTQKQTHNQGMGYSMNIAHGIYYITAAGNSISSTLGKRRKHYLKIFLIDIGRNTVGAVS
jgi:hypothetical protein